MESRIQKWGNSLAIRIPKAFAQNIDIVQDSSVNLTLEQGRLVITPMIDDKYQLNQLLNQITDDNIHGEIGTGQAIGKEVW